MKIVIDISEEYYAVCKEKAKTNIGTCSTIAKGIPLEKVFEDIKSEMKEKFWHDEAERAIDVIDKHISGKE